MTTPDQNLNDFTIFPIETLENEKRFGVGSITLWTMAPVFFAIGLWQTISSGADKCTTPSCSLGGVVHLSIGMLVIFLGAVFIFLGFFVSTMAQKKEQAKKIKEAQVLSQAIMMGKNKPIV
jgi:uncharacterized membrane protein